MQKDVFDLSSPLVCEGIVGDGCGGGRIFYIENMALFAYDAHTGINIELLQEVGDVISLEKQGCIITLHFTDKSELFDLSTFKG